MARNIHTFNTPFNRQRWRNGNLERQVAAKDVLLEDEGDFYDIHNAEAAFDQIGGDHRDYDLLLGTAANATDLGTFTGVTIPDDVSVKVALQSIETLFEEDHANYDDLLGTPEAATDLGTFPGFVITDNVDVKTALTELEEHTDWIGGNLLN